jgi:acyl-CoA thioesterase FadM
MTSLPIPVALAATDVELRAGYEGANIGPWIGFKHVNYLVEQAAISHFRTTGHDVRSLYVDNGVCWEVVDIDTRIIHVVNVDEKVRLEVSAVPAPSGEHRFDVAVLGDRQGGLVKLARSHVSVALREDSRWTTRATAVAPELTSAVVPRIRRPAPAAGFGSGPADGIPADMARLTSGRNAFTWTLRIPYFYCHFTERLQMSGYLRIMEELVDKFLADRGVSIRTLLDDKQLIPVVPRSRISMLNEVYMEEDLHAVLVVDQVFKNLTFTAAMECYVQRDRDLLNVAVGAITHGFAMLQDRGSWELTTLDNRLCKALAAASR